MRLFYGKKVHATVAIAGIVISAYAIYWLSRSDELQQIIDAVTENGSIKLSCWNQRTGKKIPIHMYSE